jgi:hypothetical protein
MPLINNAPLNGPEQMPAAPPSPEITPSVESGYDAPEPAINAVETPMTNAEQLAQAEAAVQAAEAPLSAEDKFVGDIYKLIIEDTFFSRLQEESKQNFLNDFNKFVKEQVIAKQIDKTLDQEHVSDLLFELYFPYAKKISWAHLQQDAFNDAEKLIDYLKDK